MNRTQALEVLSRAKPELAQRFGVTRLALFGSTARDTARPDSDVDIIVSFGGPATSRRHLDDMIGFDIGANLFAKNER